MRGEPEEFLNISLQLNNPHLLNPCIACWRCSQGTVYFTIHTMVNVALVFMFSSDKCTHLSFLHVHGKLVLVKLIL